MFLIITFAEYAICFSFSSGMNYSECRQSRHTKKYCVVAFLDMQDDRKVDSVLIADPWFLWVCLKLPYNYHMRWGKYLR